MEERINIFQRSEFADESSWVDGLIQYSDETATLLAKHLLVDATPETRIAVVSAPSVFVALKNILVSLNLFPPSSF